jgi:transposase
MAFGGMEPIRSKICINNKTLKQQNTFNYLGYNISYEGEKDLNRKAVNFVKVLGITNQIFKLSLVSTHTRIRIYKTLARPVLSYGSEAWTIRTDERRLISAEMRFLRRTAGYTRWGHKRNEDILTELQMSQITEFIYQYGKNWKEHVDRIPKMILKYQPKLKRNLGRPLKRWKDSVL